MKLLKLIILLSILLVSAFTKAQDILLTKKGKEYKVNILTKEEGKVTFKKYLQPHWDKHVFSLTAAKALAIKYDSGNITDLYGRSITADDFDYQKYRACSRRYMKKGVTSLCFAATFLTVGFSMLGYGLNALVETSKNPNWDTSGPIGLMWGALSAVPGIPLAIMGSLLTVKAVKFKRKANQIKPDIGFNPVLAPDINSPGQAMNVKAGMAFRITF